MTRRPVLAAVAAACVALVAGLLAPLAAASPASPHHPSKTIAGVRHRLDHLAVVNSQVVERYNAARVRTRRLRHVADAAAARGRHAEAVRQVAEAAFARSAQARYASGSIGSGEALLTSRAGSDYLRRLDGLQILARHDADVVATMREARARAARASNRTRTALTAARRAERQVGQRRSQVRAQIDKYEQVLHRLTAAQQARLRAQAASSSVRVPAHPVHANSAGAEAAVRFALAQVGKPYVFAAAGPSSYDCSGLTMMAWRAGGVSLPHSAADQYNYGTHVSESQLQPGDLIFFYHPIGHVTIYIGGGRMVSAPTTGQNVQVVQLSDFQSDYAGATHLG